MTDHVAPAGSSAAEAPAVHHGKLSVLTVAALGVVFGDIGTSPLYALQTVFALQNGAVKPTHEDVYGVISMVFWTITIIVSFKYLALVLRADNEGEGGILALVHLLRDRLEGRIKLRSAVILCGIAGAGLFYGDSVITPAISVMSAIEGLAVADPRAEHFVLPASMAILTVLFVVQRWGTAAVGRAFGPVMALWFVLLGVLGAVHVVENPTILGALSPHHALMFAARSPFIAFIALGAVVLTITGAEAMYADMGHFGPKPIRVAWFGLAFPSLTLCYLGQGAMILNDPSTVSNPFFHLAPDWATIPLVVLATLATVIASQAVISGAYSVSRQATRLGLLPRLTIVHTSKEEGGQIYVPAVNWILFCGVLVLIVSFGSSTRLASAYGLAATGTLVLGSVLFLVLSRVIWRVSIWKWLFYAVVVAGLEITIFAANALKIVSGGWLPLAIASVVVFIMLTWRRGRHHVAAKRRMLEGTLEEFVEGLQAKGIPQVPGLAIYPHPNRTTAPLALRFNTEFNHVVHEHVVIVAIKYVNVPHVRHVDRIEAATLVNGIAYLECSVGFMDSRDVPKAVALAIAQDKLPCLHGLGEEDARYFMSTATYRTHARGWRSWRRRLFILMSNNQADGATVLHLPRERTVTMGLEITV